MPELSRAHAIAKGLSTYTGKRCRAGHTTRLVRNYACAVCHGMGDTYRQLARDSAAYREERAAYERQRYEARKLALTQVAPPWEILIQSLIDPRKESTMAIPCQHKAAAIAAGHRTYESPRACLACDGNERYVKNGNCVECNLRLNRKAASTEGGKASNRERQRLHRQRVNARKRAHLISIDDM